MKQLFAIMLVFFALVSISACSALEDPPNIEIAQQYFQEHYEDLCHVAEYLQTIDGKVYVDYRGRRLDNWYDVDIPDDVLSCIKRLRGNRSRILISKNDNTIRISLWLPTMRDASSGFAYSINGTDLPEVEHTVEMMPLDKRGWYYYIEDFNQWRSTGDGSVS